MSGKAFHTSGDRRALAEDGHPLVEAREVAGERPCCARFEVGVDADGDCGHGSAPIAEGGVLTGGDFPVARVLG